MNGPPSTVRTITEASLYDRMELFVSILLFGGFLFIVPSSLFTVLVANYTASLFSKLWAIATAWPLLDTICRRFVWFLDMLFSINAAWRIILDSSYGTTPKTVLTIRPPCSRIKQMTPSSLNIVFPTKFMLARTVCTFASHDLGTPSFRASLGIGPVLKVAVAIAVTSLPVEIVDITSLHLAVNSMAFLNSMISTFKGWSIALQIRATFSLPEAYLHCAIGARVAFLVLFRPLIDEDDASASNGDSVTNLVLSDLSSYASC